MRALVRAANPQVIVNATAYTAVDRAESEPAFAEAVNSRGPGILAEEARSLGAALIHYSTDYVFDGAKGSPHVETDAPNPLGVYARSKLAGEQAVQQVGGAYLVLRTSWVYSLRRDSFVTKALRWARQQRSLKVVSAQVGNPTWARMLAEVTAQMLAKGGENPPPTPPAGKAPAGGENPRPAPPPSEEHRQGRENVVPWLAERSGVYHLAGDGYASRYEWAQAILRLDPRREEQVVEEIPPALTADFPTPARRPPLSALNCERFAETFSLRLPDWQAAMKLAMEASK